MQKMTLSAKKLPRIPQLASLPKFLIAIGIILKTLRGAAMQSEVKKLLEEVTYHKGEVMNDPQTWSETSVHGGGHVDRQYGGTVSISSSSTTWTSLILKKENGKEYMAKLPYAFPARKGHTVIAADFRGKTIAAANAITDHLNGTVNVVRNELHEEKYKTKGLKTFSGIISAPLAGILFILFLGLIFVAPNDGSAGLLIFLLMLGVSGLWYLLLRPYAKRVKLVSNIDTELPQAAQSQMREMLTT